MSTEDRIRNRQSYTIWKEFAEDLKKSGVKKLATVLKRADRLINYMGGYGSRTKADYASESMDLLIKDLKLKL